ncbi:MAG: ATP-binding protein [Patescibacteria group bacterium]|nr:ATP-binding protein [Patescibacteria group bacterium]
MLKEIDAQANKKISNATDKLKFSYNYCVKYLTSVFLVLGWTIVIVFSAPTLGRPIISGYVLLFILIGFFREIKIVLFTGILVFLSYAFLFFTYPYKTVLYPVLDISIILLSAAAIVLVVNNLNRNYANLLREKNKTKAVKESLESTVAVQTKELREMSGNLEIKIQKRTKTLERTRKALINLLEDAKEAQQIIEWEKNKTRAALVSLTDGLIVFNKEENIVLVNPEAERVLNIKEKEIVNKKIDQVAGSENLNKLYKTLNQKIKWTGQKYELVLGELLKRFFQVSITPVVVGNKTIGLMVILHDITREKEIEQLKTEFVSIAAHQLRTPLSAIKWTLRMILDGDVGKLSQEQSDFLERGYQSNERMIVLVNDLLNVARIEEGRFVCNLSPHSLEKIIEKTIDDLSAIIQKKNIKLLFEKPKGYSPNVNIDKEKIMLVIHNLMDNAVCFSRRGEKVVISVKYDKINAEVMVKDSGIGIPVSQHNRIFSKFFRAENAVRLETEGTGFGLFICKNIIEAHHGKIWFESEENKGTTFWFTLPISSQTRK